MLFASNTFLAPRLVARAGLSLLLALTITGYAWVGAAVVLAQNNTGAETSGPAQPRIMIPDPLFTFETVVDGSEVVHDFQVYNQGSRDLTIEKIETG
jgi:hypothetical protein